MIFGRFDERLHHVYDKAPAPDRSSRSSETAPAEKTAAPPRA
jgi:hypothetical protein